LMAVRTKVIMCQPIPLERRCPEAPAPLVRLVKQMLAKHPDDRPRDAGAVVVALGYMRDVPDAPRRRSSDRDPLTQANTEEEIVVNDDHWMAAVPGIGRPTGPERDPHSEDSALAFVVLAALPAEDDSADGELADSDAAAADDSDSGELALDQTVAAALASLRLALAALDGQIEPLDGGSLAVFFPDDGDRDLRASAQRAARAALLVHQHLPEAAVAVASSERSDDAEASLEEALDRVAAAVEEAEFQAIFADFRPDQSNAETTISVDDSMVELLRPEFKLEERAGGWALLPE
ncbi:MAG: hypothetical protein AAGC55_28010, partial [Myxococcota bacterium]